MLDHQERSVGVHVPLVVSVEVLDVVHVVGVICIDMVVAAVALARPVLAHAVVGQGPGVERVVDEDGKHRDDGLLVLAHDPEDLLAAAAHHALHARGPHGIDHISCQSEGHLFGGPQQFSLLKGDSEVDVDDVRGGLGQEDVGEVPVTEADDVPGHAVDGNRSCIGKSSLEPPSRVGEASQKDAGHAGRSEVLDALLKEPFLLLEGRRLAPALLGLDGVELSHDFTGGAMILSVAVCDELLEARGVVDPFEEAR